MTKAEKDVQRILDDLENKQEREPWNLWDVVIVVVLAIVGCALMVGIVASVVQP